MKLPPIAPYPPAHARSQIAATDWGKYLDLWIRVTQAYLSLSEKEFLESSKQGTSLTRFLTSYHFEVAQEGLGLSTTEEDKELHLRKVSFLLTHRIYSQCETVPPDLVHWKFLATFSFVHVQIPALRDLLASVWKRERDAVQASFQELKNTLIKTLDSSSPEDVDEPLTQLISLLYNSPDAGSFLITGSDFLEAVVVAYQNVSAETKKKLTVLTYTCLLSLLQTVKPSQSVFFDTLYSLKAGADARKGQPTLLANLVTNTPLLEKMHELVGVDGSARAQALAASLESFRDPSIRKSGRRGVDKGKGLARDHDAFGHGAPVEVHVHKLEQITQIQDIFPDLGSAFIHKLLDAFDDNVEQVTACLLEDNLPPHLASADRSEQLPPTRADIEEHHMHGLTPRNTPPPERRNVFNDDDFDRLAVDASKLHLGRKNQNQTADTLLSGGNKTNIKASVLSALAAFDPDDDERDDTYDENDVGASVDAARPGSDEVDADFRNGNEEALFNAYKLSPSTFNRDNNTRKSSPRIALRNETGMTDEAIEGWAIMLGRDPKRLTRLEAKFSTASMIQNDLASTRWRASPSASAGEESDDGPRRGGGERGRARGRGRGGHGRGGNAAGPAESKDTQVARQRKETNKSSRANHNRRDQRAKKMARGGFPG